MGTDRIMSCIAVLMLATVIVMAIGCGSGGGGGGSTPDTTAPITSASSSGGTYTSSQTVTLSANETATIYYTIDGSTPTTSSTMYSAPILISSDTTLKFFSVDSSNNQEAVKTEVYNFPEASTTVGSSGGTIEVTNTESDAYGAKITVPSGALSEDTNITIDVDTNPPDVQNPEGVTYNLFGVTYEFGPTGTSFDKSVTVQIQYTDEQLLLAGITDERSIGILRYNDESGFYESVAISSIDSNLNIVTFEIRSFSKYRMFANDHIWQLKGYKWKISTLNYFIKTADPDDVHLGKEELIRRAFLKWDSQSDGISFNEVSNESDAHIIIDSVNSNHIVFQQRDSEDTLARTLPTLDTSDASILEKAEIYFNNDILSTEFSGLQNTTEELLFEGTTLHEIGHAIGIAHAKQATTPRGSTLFVVMYYEEDMFDTNSFNARLSMEETEAVQTLYGTIVSENAPIVSIDDPSTIKSGDVTISYILIDSNGDTCSITVEYSEDGGSNFNTATDGVFSLPADAGGIRYTFVWDSITDIGTTDQSDIKIRITPSDSQIGIPDTTANFRVNNSTNTPPSVSINQPSGIQSGDVTIHYTLIDANGDTCSISVEFSEDSGTNFSDATKGTGGDNITNLSATSTGIEHTYVWDSQTDIGTTNQTDIKIRITPSDTETGTPDITDDFIVNNLTNSPPYEPRNPSPSNGAFDLPITTTLQWEGNDPDIARGDFVTYDVYLEAGDTTPDQQVSNDQASTAFNPGTLDYSKTYYWQIVATDDYGASTTGPIWNFSTSSASNTPPTASFTVTPTSGTTSTTFSVDASGCSDSEDSTPVLQVRWDWENDGTYDTSYSTTKTAPHQYSTTGTKTIKLEVKDTGNLTATTTKQVTVGSVGEWSIQTIDTTGNVGYPTSMALDSNNYPHISYYDGTNGDLKYAKGTGTSWSKTAVDSTSDVGGWNSIALDSNNYPHIAYYDSTNGDVKYTKWTGSVWSPEIVDSTGNVVPASIALDSNNYPHISCYDATNGDLKYAKWTGSTWSKTTVDSIGNVGGFSSIALDSNNYPHIAYYDNTNGDLKYAKWTGSSWAAIEIIDYVGDVGRAPSISIDNNNYPHISYYDGTNGDLKYAKWTGSTWSKTTVDNTGTVGYWSSITMDSNNYPHIAYWDGTNGDLKYTKWTGTTWSIETVDNATNPPAIVGEYPSIDLDSNNYPHISYYDSTNGDLKYIKWTAINNVAPTASFTVTPTSGTTSTTFSVDASGCSDSEDSTPVLQVRWDWENDGTYDTSYSTTKTAPHQYSTTGTKTIKLEVKDTGGLTNTTTKSVTVSEPPAGCSLTLVSADPPDGTNVNESGDITLTYNISYSVPTDVTLYTIIAWVDSDYETLAPWYWGDTEIVNGGTSGTIQLSKTFSVGTIGLSHWLHHVKIVLHELSPTSNDPSYNACAELPLLTYY